ncbi:KPN_02809 family neutral zinc metallopeptidase [Herbidospora yilanensis]|uniref:KPN_02809 family neutral zinc metallopeptidase n=1 Tax=Herbidospora yilanensis TaxID=354426 RepID=UPI000781CACA|nr:neutral zinc metallopeptidase [Herbidospora yilanensis]
MDFDDQAQLDSSQVENRGRGGIPGGGLAVGGGAAGIIALIVALVFGLNPGDITGGGGAENPGVQPSSDLGEKCKTGADADQDEQCRVVGVVNSLQDYWATQVDGYQNAKTALFEQGVQTGCGAADSAVGPFYCPADRYVYLDLSFFNQLESQLGAANTPFAQSYVIAHEYGHHVQNLTGTLEQSGGEGAGSGSVRVELQADCYAGVWAKNAVDTGFFAKPFTDADIQEALDAAAAVGDDSIQRKSGGQVNPDAFTHGTSEQRVTWFTNGYKSGDPARCDTFSGSI